MQKKSIKYRAALAAEWMHPFLLSNRDISISLARSKDEMLLSKSLGFKDLDSTSLSEKVNKKGRVFFILGSGPSISELSEDQYEIMSKNVTLGINKWFMNSFDTDFYMFEGRKIEQKESNYRYWFDDAIARYAEASESTFLLKDVASSFSCWDVFSKNFRERSFVIPKFSVPGRSLAAFRYNLHKISRNTEAYPLLFRRGSISLALSLAARLNFDKVVLCGVDMNDGSYFWEDPRFKVRNGYSKPNTQRKLLHSTIDSEVHPVTLDKVLIDFKEMLFDDVSLYVSSKASSLSRFLPVFDWGNL